MNYYNCVLCMCGTVFGTGRKERGWIISTMGTHDTHALQLWSTLMDMTALSSSLPLVSSPIIHVEAHFDRVSCLSLTMLTCTMPLFVQMMELCEFGRTLLTRGIQRWSQRGRGCPTCCPLHEVCYHTHTLSVRIPLFFCHLSFFSPIYSLLGQCLEKAVGISSLPA